MQAADIFLFEVFPYLALAIFLVGSWIRYDYAPYTWRAGSSQIMSKKGMFVASNLFHLGMLGIIVGHTLGMLTPHWVYEGFLPLAVKQQMAMMGGGVCGVMIVIGGAFLLKRRITEPRVRASSSTADILILALIVVQALIGLVTIGSSLQHMDGKMMMQLVGWAQAMASFHPGGAATLLEGVPFVFKVHLVLGLLLFVLFPFTRLVHVWSIPLEYLTRRYQLVRARRVR
jgi:respiratory nitrate reductase, gamma subunit